MQQSEIPIPQKVCDVYDVFKNFFGEQFVDLQKGISYIIYVWWPSVLVTNEYNRSVSIQDLYAKIRINSEGLIPFECPGFQLNRATYPKDQFLSGYLHSHIRDIPKNDFTEFLNPCLGSGPIRNTINTLKTDYDIAEWMLFCQELSMYVTVESIAGGPWRRMENIGSSTVASNYINYDFNVPHFCYPLFFTNIMQKEFIQYYLTNGHLSLSFQKGQFICGMPYYDFIIDISNAFISYCNSIFFTERDKENLFSHDILKQLLVSNGKFYLTRNNNDTNNQNLDRYRNKYVLTFKGKKIYTTITEVSIDNSFPVTVINYSIAMDILRNILKVINYRYKNEHNNNNTASDSPKTCQRTVYI